MSANNKADAYETDGETPDVQCSICLDEITDVCHTDMCTFLLRMSDAVVDGRVVLFAVQNEFQERTPFVHRRRTVPGTRRSCTVARTQIPIRRDDNSRSGVYHQDVWAVPLSDSNGGLGGVSYRFFRDNPEQTIRLREFAHRDVSQRPNHRVPDECNNDFDFRSRNNGRILYQTLRTTFLS